MSRPNTGPLRARSRVSIITLFGLLFVGAVLLLILPAGAMSTGQPSPRTGDPASPDDICWQVVSSPNEGTADNILHAVAAVSTDDVWAVGYYEYDAALHSRTLVEHWNGTEWSIVPSPNPGTDEHYLYDVAALSANDVWAVGEYVDYDGAYHRRTLMEHWNGTFWSVVPSPNQGTGYISLSGVAAVSPTDAWAVGSYYDNNASAFRTLVERWNGTFWSVVPSPNQGTDPNYLSGVAAASPTDVWAVGMYGIGDPNFRTLIEHFNGTEWSIVPSPNQGTRGSRLRSVDAASLTDAWAVGSYYDNNASAFRTLVERWNGTFWSVVPSPNQGTGYNYLYGVTAISANDVWAVGDYDNGGRTQTLIEHWDGTFWSVVPSSNPGTDYNALSGVAAVSPTDMWAVGYYHVTASALVTMIERYSDSCIPPTSTPTATSTATPTATSTLGPGEFYDVPPGSTFYPYVHCLALRGIISGYPDGTFRPSNPVTRGQLSKIVSNSAGYTEAFSTNTFEDVPLGSTFFPYVERLYFHGRIAGYACGGPGEPCNPPANRPYFRPGANVTRGQTSKIVATAKGLPAPSPGQQTFEDVAIGTNFWQWIEPLAATGAIGGYPCGGEGEPCNPPTNRPYFRPGTNVTRGQSAKIVSNTFFPNCTMPGMRK